MFLQLSNSNERVKLCRAGFSFLKNKHIDKGWRIHSAGYAVLQYTQFGRINTLYMHKLLAEEFIYKPETQQKLFVFMKNGNKLDCRLENLQWTTMAELRRQQTAHERMRGVSKDGKKYRAVLYDNGERIYLGVYETAEKAAFAYDEESFKRFGITRSLNFPNRFQVVGS